MRVFVSSTTKDLGACREAASAVLRKAQLVPVVQEELPASYLSLHEVLFETVASCDAVICLVGDLFGEAPAEQSDRFRSYTQLEYDAACELGKPIFVFLARRSYQVSDFSAEPDSWRKAQEEHRARLLRDHKCEWFVSVDDLRLQVAQLVPRLLDLAVQAIYYLHPPERPAFFVGRQFETEQLEACLRNPSPSILAVVGMAGQGKTTLVSEFLRVRRGLRFGAGFWCTAYRASFTFDMFLDEALAYLSRGSFLKRSRPEPAARVRSLMEHLQARRVLLIIDGIERWLRGWMHDDAPSEGNAIPDPRAASQEGLDDFLREISGLSNGTHLILTTRALPRALDYSSVALVPVYPEDQEPRLRGIEVPAAVDLMRRQRVRGSDSQLAAVAKQWDCHPLTLLVLSALLFKRYGGDIERMPMLSILDPRLPINTLLEETRKHLADPALGSRVMMAASLAEENPQLPLILTGWKALTGGQEISEDRLLDSVVGLSEWQLLEWDGEAGHAIIHPLIRNYFENLLSPSERIAVHTAFAEWYSGLPLPENPSELFQVRPRILAMVHYCRAAKADKALALLFSRLPQEISFLDWLVGAGHHVAAIGLLGRIAVLVEERERGRLLSVRGSLHFELGAMAAALVDLNDSIGLLEKSATTPEAALDLAGALMNRGNTRRAQGDKQALDDFDRALALLAGIADLRWVLAANWLTAQVRLNRSNYLSDRGRLSDALADIDASIEKCRSLTRLDFSGSGPILANGLANRGLLYLDTGQYRDAIPDFDEASNIHTSLHNLGRCDLRAKFAELRAARAVALDEAGGGEEVLLAFDDAVADLQSLAEAGRDDVEPPLALALMNRSFALLRRGSLDLAIPDGERALAIFRRQHRDERRANGRVGHTLLILAEARFRQGRFDESRELRDQGLAVLEELIVAGATCQPVLIRKTAQAAIYWVEKDPQEAVALLNRAASIAERALTSPESQEALAIELARVCGQLEGAAYRFTSADGSAALDRITALLEGNAKITGTTQ